MMEGTYNEELNVPSQRTVPALADAAERARAERIADFILMQFSLVKVQFEVEVMCSSRMRRKEVGFRRVGRKAK